MPSEPVMREPGGTEWYVKKCPRNWIGRTPGTLRFRDGTRERRWISYTLGPVDGPGAITRNEAEWLFRETVIAQHEEAKLRPRGLMPIREFIEKHFVPDVVDCDDSTREALARKTGLRLWRPGIYRRTLTWVDIALGDYRLVDVVSEDAEKIYTEILESRLCGRSRHWRYRVTATLKAVLGYARHLGYLATDR